MKSILAMICTGVCAASIGGLSAKAALAADLVQATCTMATFKGNYGVTLNGTITPGGGTVLYIQGVQMIHSDGQGNLTDNEALVINGTPLADAPPSFFSLHTGTYTLNSDCTGLAYLSNLNQGGSSFIWLSFIVDEQGKQIRMVGVPPFDGGGIPRTLTSVGQRVGD